VTVDVLNKTVNSGARPSEDRRGREARQAPRLAREMRLVDIARLEGETGKAQLAERRLVAQLGLGFTQAETQDL